MASVNPPASGAATFNLADLDEYSVMEVLDRVDLDDLLTLADTSHWLRHLIERHYIAGKYRLNEQIVRIFIEGDLYNLTISTDGTHTMTLDRRDSFVRLFRLFGSHISHLHIDRPRSLAKAAQFEWLARHIERYSRHSLKTLNLQRQSNELLALWHESFDRVQSVDITPRQPPAFGLPALFPNARVLNITVVTDFAYEHLHFPHLAQLKYRDYKAQGDNAILTELLARNQRVRWLRLDRLVDMATLNYISANLHHMDYFRYSGSIRDLIRRREDGGAIPLLSVRHFSVDLIFEPFASPPIPFVFERLQTLDISYRGLSPSFAEFVARNRHLRRLSLIYSGPLQVDLLALVEPLAELEALDFQWTTDTIPVGHLTELLGRRRLTRVKAILIDERAEDVERIEQAVPRGWHCSKTILDKYSLYLEFQREGT